MRRLLGITAITLALTATGCAALDSDETGIVVTTNILGDLTAEIVGDEAEVTVLMAPGADPHSFGATAKQAAAIERAELLVHNGLGLEEGVAGHVEAAESQGTPAVAVGAAVDPIDYVEGQTAGEADPHFWTDPVRVAEAVDVIAERVIAEVDGVDAETITDNAAAYRARIEALHEDNTTAFAKIPAADRELVTNHHVFGYLAQRYDFTVIGAVVPSGSTLASPSSADLADLADAIRDADVPAIFVDSSQPDRLAEALAAETGVDVDVIPLYSESLTGPDGGAATYLEMARANTERITDGLG